MKFDYIIVGAGSAGCVLANRLSEDPNVSVCLIDFGGSDNSIFIKMPTALSIPMNMDKYNWGFKSTPEKGLQGRVLDCPRGKVMGGSSSINGMVYVRGHACDFDQWETAGAKGWSYQDVLPYFKKAENWVKGGDIYRGDNGPVAVCGGNDMKKNPLYEAFIDAGVEAGYPKTTDYNGQQQEGFGPMHMTVDKGVRASTAHAYLKPIKNRKNLHILDNCLVDKVLFEGKRATSVRMNRHKKQIKITANHEIILSAGAVGSPAILQRSGIGDANALSPIGIKPINNLPGVGQNLQDHLEVYFQFECLKPVSLNSRLSSTSKALIGARWFFFKSGLGATNHFESCAFIRSKSGQKWPDIQYHFLPAAMRYDGQSAFDGHGFQVHVGPNKPKSRGHVSISSLKAEIDPKISFNYLTDEDDIKDWRHVIRLTREILNQPSLDMYRGEEIQPGNSITTDAEIDQWVRDNVESAYHPSCTCKMGAADDEMAVVDNQCRVFGVENLRVVDASIFPTIPNGNLNAPTIMVAEKAADIIRNRPALPPVDAPVWIDPQWQTRQRANAPSRPAEKYNS
jgi:choline dehydrogenase